MIASTFLCSIVIGFVCTKVVEPRFGKYEGNTDEKIEKLTSEESKGLRAAAITAIVYIILLVIGFFTGPLAAENGGLRWISALKGSDPDPCLYSSPFVRSHMASLPVIQKIRRHQ